MEAEASKEKAAAEAEEKKAAADASTEVAAGKAAGAKSGATEERLRRELGDALRRARDDCGAARQGAGAAA